MENRRPRPIWRHHPALLITAVAAVGSRWPGRAGAARRISRRPDPHRTHARRGWTSSPSTPSTRGPTRADPPTHLRRRYAWRGQNARGAGRGGAAFVRAAHKAASRGQGARGIIFWPGRQVGSGRMGRGRDCIVPAMQRMATARPRPRQGAGVSGPRTGPDRCGQRQDSARSRVCCLGQRKTACACRESGLDRPAPPRSSQIRSLDSIRGQTRQDDPFASVKIGNGSFCCGRGGRSTLTRPGPGWLAPPRIA